MAFYNNFMKDIRISIRLTEEQHKKIKIISIKRSISMQDMMSEYIKKIIEENDDEKGND